MKRPKKPYEPAKPTEPSKTWKYPHRLYINESISFADIRKQIPNVISNDDIWFELSNVDDYEDVYDTYIVYYTSEPNQKYEQEIVRYEKKYAEYIKNMEAYKPTLAAYEKETAIYDEWFKSNSKQCEEANIKKEIDFLKKKLAKLEKKK